jgi:hypothetical protein
MATFSNNFGAKKNKNEQHTFYCETCDYTCYKKYNWDRHILTAKHQNATKLNKNEAEKEQKILCENCNKEYKDRTGLWRHKKKCVVGYSHENNINNLTTLICDLVKNNTDIHKSLIELCKNGTK